MKMKRNPGQELRYRLIDRVLDASTLIMAGIGCLLSVVMIKFMGSPSWFVVMFGIALCLVGAMKLTGRGRKGANRWRLRDMRKGAHSEERVGAVIEYALTQPHCAIAHGVMDIAKEGDIDHLIATPQRIWVVESKYGRLPPREFARTLRRIVVNVNAVSEWEPNVEVVGCLVFGGDSNAKAKSSYTRDDRQILCFRDPKSLAQQLRREAGAERTVPEGMARKVWSLASANDPA